MTTPAHAGCMRTVVDEICDAAGGAGALTMMNEPGGPMSWHEVHERARRVATVLIGHGLGPGSRVGLTGPTSGAMAVAFQAVWLIGGCVTVLPPLGRGAAVEHARRVVADAGLVAVLGEDVDLPVPVISIEGLMRQAMEAPPAEVYRPAPDDLAVLQYTSGSTRQPQGVPVTHGHLMSNVEGIRSALRHDEWHPGQWLSWLPLYHDMGLIAFFILPMTCGCPLALEPPEAFAGNPIGWLQKITTHRAVISGAPNFAYALMTKLLDTGRFGPGLDMSSIRMLVSGGEPVDPEMMGRFTTAAATLGLDPASLMPAYGLAEATLAAAITPPGAGLRVDCVDPMALESTGIATPMPGGRKLVRTGIPVPGVRIRITDRHDGRPVGPRVVGLVELCGGSVIGRYHGQPAVSPDAWMGTGDLGYLTDEGELVVCGREKDVVFAAGRNIFPQDVEAVAQETPGVRSGGAAAFGIADGDRLVVAVESRVADPAEVRRNVSARVLAEVGLTPREVIVLPYGQLPKTTSGKLRRAEARRRYLAGEFNRR